MVQQFNTGILTISSALTSNGAGSPSLVKVGPGTTVLTGTNTYTGPTIVGGGSLQGSTGSIPTAVTLQNGANVNYQQDTNATLATGISGNGSFTKSGSGMLTLTGTSTYSGATTISGGTLQLGAAAGVTGFGGSGAPSGWGLHGFDLHAVPPAPVFWSGGGNPYPSVVTNNLAVLTTSASGGEAASMFYLATQPVVGQPWQAKFTYTNVNGNGDNGGAFVLQMGQRPTPRQRHGPTRKRKGLTFGSNNPIYNGVPYTSAEIVWNIDGGSQLDFTTRTNSNTSTPTGNGVNLDAASSPVNITLSYDGVSTIYLIARQGSNAWTQLYTGANLAATLASPSGGLAYVGFTGGNNTASTEQDLANFSLSYQNLPAATPVNLTAAGAGMDINGIPQEIGSLSGVTGAHVSLGGGNPQHRRRQYRHHLRRQYYWRRRCGEDRHRHIHPCRRQHLRQRHRRQRRRHRGPNQFRPGNRPVDVQSRGGFGHGVLNQRQSFGQLAGLGRRRRGRRRAGQRERCVLHHLDRRQRQHLDHLRRLDQRCRTLASHRRAGQDGHGRDGPVRQQHLFGRHHCAKRRPPARCRRLPSTQLCGLDRAQGTLDLGGVNSTVASLSDGSGGGSLISSDTAPRPS